MLKCLVDTPGTVRGICSDFGKMYQDNQCPIPGCDEGDSLSHTLVCIMIRGELEEVDVSGVSLDDVFSSSIEEQKKITDVYGSVVDMRESIRDFLATKDDNDVYIGDEDDV